MFHPARTTLLVVLVLLLSFAAGASLWFFGIRDRTSSPAANVNSQSTTVPEQSTAATRALQIPATQQADRDRDGMTDDAETAAGTDPDKPDSDGDGLTDREETAIYRTEPNSRDTDSDGADDGTEVETGQNPNGAGMLLDAASAIRALKATNRSTQQP